MVSVACWYGHNTLAILTCFLCGLLLTATHELNVCREGYETINRGGLVRRPKVEVTRLQNSSLKCILARCVNNYLTDFNQTWQSHIAVNAHCVLTTRVLKVKDQGHTRLKIDSEAWWRHRHRPTLDQVAFPWFVSSINTRVQEVSIMLSDTNEHVTSRTWLYDWLSSYHRLAEACC